MTYPEFTPDLFDEHFDDGRPLDNEIDDSPRMVFDPGYELSVSNEIVGDLMVGVEQDAILATLAQVRDNRRPCPPMKAVDLDAPLEPDILGEAFKTAPGGPYPVTAQLIEAWRASGKPRIVRVDTEADHQAFRDTSSPERMALLERMAHLEQKLAAHLHDPDAHSLADADEDLAEAHDLRREEEAKQIPMRMPRHFDGLLEQWNDGKMAAGAMLLPHKEGGRWVTTASESLKRGELEAAKAAAEAVVPASAIVGYLPGIGASLAAADAIKSLASGAESILKRPEAKGRRSFMVRLDPQVSPTIFALAELLCLCQAGNPEACDEWNRLAAATPAPLRQAMAEIQAALKPPQPQDTATAMGGAIGDFFSGLWTKIRYFFGGQRPETKAAPAPLTAAPRALPAKSSVAPTA